MAYRVLKNAGFVPPEVAKRADAARLQSLLLDASVDDRDRRRAARRLSLLMTELERAGNTHLGLRDEYYQKIVRKVTR